MKKNRTDFINAVAEYACDKNLRYYELENAAHVVARQLRNQGTESLDFYNYLCDSTEGCSRWTRFLNDTWEKRRDIIHNKVRQIENESRLTYNSDYIVVFPSNDPSYKFSACRYDDMLKDRKQVLGLVGYGNTTDEAIGNLKHKLTATTFK